MGLSKPSKFKSFTTLEILPNELILELMSFLSSQDLLQTACVCRRWYSLSGIDLLWYKFTSDCFPCIPVYGLNRRKRKLLSHPWSTTHKQMYLREKKRTGLYLLKRYNRRVATFRWKIKDWSKLPFKYYSDIFYVNERPWRVLVFPKGNQTEGLSIYLDVADADDLPSGWTQSAYFHLLLYNQKFANKKWIQQFHKKEFNSEERDWGWRDFIPAAKFKEEGYIFNDRVVLEFTICTPIPNEKEKANANCSHIEFELEK
eukprot:gb/GECH01010434.1/.p1 GENE.gb/GECH01010434.1/~~gb/GECH01010434.1/.p1  ORF type:complete len:258 (+),score=44.90 gb/GECH01010434.1/:1-774(+)